MDIIDNTQASLSALGDTAAQLRGLVPRELVYFSLGVFGVGIGVGALIGVLSHRALTQTDGGESNGANYQAWTKAKLYDLASERDIAGRGDMTKDELIEALAAA